MTDIHCRCNEFGSRDVTVQIFASDVSITHVQCGKPVYLDHEYLMSAAMPMTLTYSVDEDADEAYQVLSSATGESAEPDVFAACQFCGEDIAESEPMVPTAQIPEENIQMWAHAECHARVQAASVAPDFEAFLAAMPTERPAP